MTAFSQPLTKKVSRILKQLIWNQSPNYSLNCTPLRPITIAYHPHSSFAVFNHPYSCIAVYIVYNHRCDVVTLSTLAGSPSPTGRKSERTFAQGTKSHGIGDVKVKWRTVLRVTWVQTGELKGILTAKITLIVYFLCPTRTLYNRGLHCWHLCWTVKYRQKSEYLYRNSTDSLCSCTLFKTSNYWHHICKFNHLVYSSC